jgi:hypothetical protein
MVVVVPGVLVQHSAQVWLTEDQHPVGQFGADGEHEPLGVGVRPRTAGRDLHDGDAGVGEDRVEAGGELPGPVPDQIVDGGRPVSQIEQVVPGLLDMVHAASGFAVTPRMCTYRESTSSANST